MKAGREDTKRGFIKRKSYGRTNEISFSILDAAAESSDDKQAEPWDIRQNIAVKNRKKKRRRKKLIAGLGIATACLVFITFIIFGIANFIQSTSGTNDRLKSLMRNSVEVIDNTQEINSTLNTLLSADVSTISNSISSKDLTTIRKKTEDKITELQDIKSKLEATLNEVAIPADKEAGNSCLELINSEIETSRQCVEIYQNYAFDYLQDRELAVKAINYILEGDSADREASSLILEGKIESAQSSLTKINDALNSNKEAKSCFESMSDANRAQFEDYISFCQYRIEAQEASYKVAEAYINRNKEELDAQNQIYNSKQEEATKIADTWDREPKELLDENMEAARKSDSSKFKSLQEKRELSIRKVKDYLK